MSLTDEQLERYARHIVLREVGGPGQAKLLAARVLVIGAGGTISAWRQRLRILAHTSTDKPDRCRIRA